MTAKGPREAPAAPPAPATHARLIRLDGFEPACPDASCRRYSMLFADEGASRRGGLGTVTRVTNAYGETLALKTPLPQEGASPAAAGAGTEGCPGPAVPPALLDAFRREYEGQRALAGLSCVPAVLGWGELDGMPAILMEWVEGVTLERARAELAVDDAGRVSPPVVAALGRDLMAALADLAQATPPVIHRDVSPANVMVRTSALSLAQQAEDGTFDLCLVDFGSATVPVAAGAGAPDSSLTRAGALVRWATPDYAPPEMLTDDVAGVAELRESASIDVYAAAGVLLDLACARPPFGERGALLAAGASPYRTKMDREPECGPMAHADESRLDAVLAREPLVAASVARAALELDAQPSAGECARALREVDDRLGQALLACLAPGQDGRPEAAAVRDELAVIAACYDENVGRALRGEPLEPREPGLVPAVGVASARRALRVAAQAAALGMTAAVCLLCAPALGPWSLALALPMACASLLRHGRRQGMAGLLRGTGGALLGCAAAAGTLLAGRGVAPASLTPALLACATVAWVPVVADYATLTAERTDRKTREEDPCRK